jgi:hypothetical protein
MNAENTCLKLEGHSVFYIPNLELCSCDVCGKKTSGQGYSDSEDYDVCMKCVTQYANIVWFRSKQVELILALVDYFQ